MPVDKCTWKGKIRKSFYSLDNWSSQGPSVDEKLDILKVPVGRGKWTFNMESGGHYLKSHMASLIVGPQDIVDLQTQGKMKHTAPPTKGSLNSCPQMLYLSQDYPLDLSTSL